MYGAGVSKEEPKLEATGVRTATAFTYVQGTCTGSLIFTGVNLLIQSYLLRKRYGISFIIINGEDLND